MYVWEVSYTPVLCYLHGAIFLVFVVLHFDNVSAHNIFFSRILYYQLKYFTTC